MDFFKVTQEDINAVGGQIKWKGGEQPTLTITDLKERDVNGQKNLVVECVVSNCEPFNGQSHSYFINDKAGSKRAWIDLLRTFFDEAKIISGTLTPVDLRGKQFLAIVKKRTFEGKEYSDVKPLKEVSSVPTLDGASSIPANIF